MRRRYSTTIVAVSAALCVVGGVTEDALADDLSLPADAVEFDPGNYWPLPPDIESFVVAPVDLYFDPMDKDTQDQLENGPITLDLMVLADGTSDETEIDFQSTGVLDLYAFFELGDEWSWDVTEDASLIDPLVELAQTTITGHLFVGEISAPGSQGGVPVSGYMMLIEADVSYTSGDVERVYRWTILPVLDWVDLFSAWDYTAETYSWIMGPSTGDIAQATSSIPLAPGQGGRELQIVPPDCSNRFAADMATCFANYRACMRTARANRTACNGDVPGACLDYGAVLGTTGCGAGFYLGTLPAVGFGSVAGCMVGGAAGGVVGCLGGGLGKWWSCHTTYRADTKSCLSNEMLCRDLAVIELQACIADHSANTGNESTSP